MSATFLQLGDAIDYTPSADVPVGSVVVLGDLVGVVIRPIPAGHLGALHLRGVFALPKATGSGKAIPPGKKVYWHVGDQVVQTAASGGKVCGHTVADADENDTHARVRLEAV